MEHDLIFSIAEIQEKEGLTFTGTMPVEELTETGSDLSGFCAIHLEFSVGGQSILMEGEVKGQWRLPCSRCLEPHPEPFEGRLEETYPLALGSIDVKEDVRQALILSLPSKSLCRSDCRGLCPQCGKDLNPGSCSCQQKENYAKPKT